MRSMESMRWWVHLQVVSKAKVRKKSFFIWFFQTAKNKMSLQQRWSQTSPELLEHYETRLLCHLRTPFKLYPVRLDPQSSLSGEFIHTLELAAASDARTPVVVMHGFASAKATFVNVLQALSERCGRKVYAIDLLGFGRSSKPSFPADDTAAEALFVESVEAWRASMRLPSIAICAHSFGAYIAARYAERYPDRVETLVLFEPWGVMMDDQPRRCWWSIEGLASTVNPLALLRLAGPVALPLMRALTWRLFSHTFASIGAGDEMLMYLYHSNAQCTGDAGFMAMLAPHFQAKRPVVDFGSRRVVIIRGSRSWIVPAKGLRGVEQVMILGAGHQVYAEQPDTFIKEVVQSLVCI